MSNHRENFLMDFISNVFESVGVSAFTYAFGWMHFKG